MLIGGNLAAPRGVALAPSTFGQFANDLLVGNFSYKNSFISAFDPVTGAFEGMIQVDTGSNTPGGLWALDFGVGGMNGDPNTLYFTDGINGETDGLFGAIDSTPRRTPALRNRPRRPLGLLSWRRKRKSGAKQA
jgi:uncharacterized protein (TIGR03118 family)